MKASFSENVIMRYAFHHPDHLAQKASTAGWVYGPSPSFFALKLSSDSLGYGPIH